MRDIELEEGEAYYLQDDDDENIDPDKDFSYIDKKIENYLGNYQKDFMRGLSAEGLGATYGGYGSFLPMKQRSPRNSSNQETQIPISSKTSQNLPSEHFRRHPTAAVNHPLPLKPGSGSIDNDIQALNNPLNLQGSAECTFSNQQKKPMIHHSEQKSLKFRVKMTAENVLSGLGLDISPSSLEDSPSESEGTSPGMQKMKPESPSYIIKTMTEFPVPNDDLLSPLHDSLSSLTGIGKNLATALPGYPEAVPVNSIHGSTCSEGKREASEHRNLKVKDPSMNRNSKQKELTEERNSSKKVQGVKPVDLMKENQENFVNAVAISANKREESGTSMAEVNVIPKAAINEVDAHFGDTSIAALKGKSTGSKVTLFDKKSEVGCSEEDLGNSMQQVLIARDKVKGGSALASSQNVAAVKDECDVNTLRVMAKKGENAISFLRKESRTDQKNEPARRDEEANKSWKQQSVSKDKVKGLFLDSIHPKQDGFVSMKGESTSASSLNAAAVKDEWGVNTSRVKTEKDENATSFMRKESSTDQRNEDECRDEEANESLKQQCVSKDKVTGKFLDSIHPKQAGRRRKETVMCEKIPKVEDIGFVPMKGVEENDKHFDMYEEMKDNIVEALEPSKEKTQSKLTPQSQMVAGVLSGKEHPSSSAKTKSRARQADGICTAEPPRRSLVLGISAAEKEGVFKHELPSKSNRSDIDLRREMKKGSNVASDVYSSKKRKDVSSKDFVMGVSERETHASIGKLMDNQSSNNSGFALNFGSSMEGDLAATNCVMDSVNWVQCEECQKWRILPPGMDPDSLPKEWICSMQTWLPGRNRCSVSEDETTEVMHALYPTPVPMSQAQNYQQAHPDGFAFLGSSGGAQHVGLSGRAANIDANASGGKRRNLVKTETDAAKQSGFQEHTPVKKNQQHSELRNSRIQKKLPRELNGVRKSGDGKPSKIERKRVADFEGSVVPKRMKIVHQQSIENPDLVGPSKVDAKAGNRNYDPGAPRVTKDFTKGSLESPVMRAKDRNQNAMIAKDSELKDVRGKKRKLDQWENVTSAEERFGKVQHSLKNSVSGKNSGTELRKEKKAKKSMASKFQERESSTDKANGRIHTDGGNHNIRSAGDKSRPKSSRTGDMPLEEHHADRASQKTANIRKSSDKGLVLGLSNIATTSSSSKISSKVKAKAYEVKSSPVGSISSSPKRTSTCDPDKGRDKMSIPFNEQGLMSAKQLKSRDGTEFTPNSEEMRNNKSSMLRNSGAMSGTAVEGSVRKIPAEIHPGARRIDIRTKVQDNKDACGKPDHVVHEAGASTQAAKPLNRLNFDETNFERGKSHVPQISNEMEPPCHSHGVSEVQKGNRCYADNVNVKLSNPVEDDQVSLKHPLTTGQVSEEINASSSMKKDSYHRAAKTALREAKSLKHSADRLKVSGSGVKSTEVFFQAALKFLQGASLLEPGNSESGKGGEMTSTEVYSTTAKLCERCALEYERHNDMASASLAYKCMEVAYMRVVYFNDIAASRDRVELQMAVRAVPQVESPSSSASDIDNLNNQAATDAIKDGRSAVDHRVHVISAGNRPNFMRLLNFTNFINLAMEASRKSQTAFVAANPTLAQAGNEEGISSIKRVLDFSFHDVDGLLDLVRLAMEALGT